MISFQSILLACVSLALAMLPKYLHAVPPDYCFYPVNTSDCGVQPTPVFYYYKPGSRCELITWRGCPTYNKFVNEIECSNTCIFRYSSDEIYDEIMKYIYSNMKLKIPQKDVSHEDWEDNIKTLPDRDVENLNNILDDVIDEGVSTIKTTSTTEQHTTTAKSEDVSTTQSVQFSSVATTEVIQPTDTINETTELLTQSTIEPTTETTKESTTIPTTESTTKSTTEFTTITTTVSSTVPTTKRTTEPTTKPTTEPTTEPTTKPTTTTEPTTVLTTVRTTTQSAGKEETGLPEEVITV